MIRLDIGVREPDYLALGHVIDSPEQIRIDIFADEIRSLQRDDTIDVYRVSEGDDVSYATSGQLGVDWTVLLVGVFCMGGAVMSLVEAVSQARLPPPSGRR